MTYKTFVIFEGFIKFLKSLNKRHTLLVSTFVGDTVNVNCFLWDYKSIRLDDTFVSTTTTFFLKLCESVAPMFTEVVVFPTPPFPEITPITFPMIKFEYASCLFKQFCNLIMY